MSQHETAITETTVRPVEDGVLVRVQIADGSIGPDATATIHLDLALKLPDYRTALLAHYQREAICLAHAVLSEHLLTLRDEIQHHHKLHPTLKNMQ